MIIGPPPKFHGTRDNLHGCASPTDHRVAGRSDSLYLSREVVAALGAVQSVDSRSPTPLIEGPCESVEHYRRLGRELSSTGERQRLDPEPRESRHPKRLPLVGTLKLPAVLGYERVVAKSL